MKVSTVALGLVLAAAVVPAADEEPVTVTTTFYGETDTHKWGRFDKTKPASTSTSSGTHKWGRFDKTKSPVTVTKFVTDSSEKAYGLFKEGKINGTAVNGTAGNGTNGSSGSTLAGNGVSMNSLNIGVAGAMAAGLLLVL